MRSSARMTYGYYLLGLVIGLLLFWLTQCAHADPATHRLPDMQRKMQVWLGDATTGFVVPTSTNCSPPVPASTLTFPAFSCEAYTKDTSTGELLYTAQPTATLGPLNAGSGLYWLLISRDTSTTYAGWTHQAGTRYHWQHATTIPVAPSGTLLFAEVTVSGVITAVVPTAPLSPTEAALGAVLVHRHTTGGDGSAARPWTGWDTAVRWAASRTYLFPAGSYAFAGPLQWGYTDIQILTMGEVILVHTGTGVAIAIDKSSGTLDPIYGVHIGPGLKIQAGSGTTDGLLIRGVGHSLFENVRVAGATVTTGSCFKLEWNVANVYINPRCSGNEGANLPKPGYGMFVTKHTGAAGSSNSTDNMILNPVMEIVTTGIQLDYADENLIIGGTLENNVNGLVITANGNANKASSVFYEANSTIDQSIDGFAHRIDNSHSAGVNTVQAGAVGVVIQGGWYSNVGNNWNVVNGSHATTIRDIRKSGAISVGATAIDYQQENVYDIPGTALLPNISSRVGSTLAPHYDLRSQAHPTWALQLGIDDALGAGFAQTQAVGPLWLQPLGAGVKIGVGASATILKHLTGTLAHDPPSVASGAQYAYNVAVAGAALGGKVECTYSLDLTGLHMAGYVDAANSTICLLINNTGSAVDLAAGTSRAVVTQY